jgi:hypothetical protein
MTKKYANVNLVLLPEQKKLLELWAKNEDRSLSAVPRRIIDQEADRREAEKKQVTTVKSEDL